MMLSAVNLSIIVVNLTVLAGVGAVCVESVDSALDLVARGWCLFFGRFRPKAEDVVELSEGPESCVGGPGTFC